MKSYNDWYIENEADEVYKKYYDQKKELRQKYLAERYLEEAAAISDNIGEDIADFTNEVIDGITVENNRIVFKGKTKETKTYSMKLVELLGRELGRELGKLPGMIFDDMTRSKEKKRK